MKVNGQLTWRRSPEDSARPEDPHDAADALREVDDLQAGGQGHGLVEGRDEAGGKAVDVPGLHDAPIGCAAVGEDDDDDGLAGVDGEDGDRHGGGGKWRWCGGDVKSVEIIAFLYETALCLLLFTTP